MDRIENDSSNSYSIVAWIVIAAVTFSPSRFLATIGRYTYRHTDLWEGFMKYAVEMSSGVMIYIPSFIKIGSDILKLIGGYTDTQTDGRDL
jgi:hypothetical protein